ncbi:MAG: hypothetical protein IKX94_07090 [Muribaculaceae bacterium]|nr:hypothetical protein [Muribaculaceae bacterium]
MTVYINEHPIKIFAGARLHDVLRSYMVLNGLPYNNLEQRITARDRFGNIVALSSPTRHNRKYSITFNEYNPHDEEDSIDL